LPFRWPAWAPPKDQIGKLLPAVDDSSELVIETDKEKRDAVKEAFAVSAPVWVCEV
jgi:hypothetical protein